MGVQAAFCDAPFYDPVVERFDVAVVGGGPAGLATAIAAVQQGLRAVVFEAAPADSAPIDKACGEGLMPAGVRALAALGVDALALGHPFVGIRFLEGKLCAEGRFRQGSGVGIRRTRLHAALLQAAGSAGVDLRFGHRVGAIGATGEIDTEAAWLDGPEGRIEARFLVGADGLHSRVRRWAGLERRTAPRAGDRFGVRRHYRLAPWSEFVEVSWAPVGEAYVTPVGDDEVGVAFLWSGRKAGFDDLMAFFPELRARLGDAPAVSKDRGAGPLRQRTRDVVRGRTLLVGDAAGYVDAITGEGLALAFEEAFAAAAAMANGELSHYRSARRAIHRGPDTLTHLMMFAERRPALRRFVLRRLAKSPNLFARLLGVHS